MSHDGDQIGARLDRRRDRVRAFLPDRRAPEHKNLVACDGKVCWIATAFVSGGISVGGTALHCDLPCLALNVDAAVEAKES